MVKAGVNPEDVSPTQNPFNGNSLFHPPELRGHVYYVMLNLMYQDWSIAENATFKLHSIVPLSTPTTNCCCIFTFAAVI